MSAAKGEDRLVRPLPKTGEADCPRCGAKKSVARHNADWTCHKCGFVEVVDTDRKPAEVWPVGHFIENEMRERGWTRRELALRLGGLIGVNQLALHLLIDVPPRKGVLLGEDFAADLAKVFGTSAELWLNLDKAWQTQQKL